MSSYYLYCIIDYNKNQGGGEIVPEAKSSLRRHAEYYAKLGLRVFPCNGKVPATPHGCKDATTDLDQIARWWGPGSTYNIGVATGNGLVVLDADVGEGKWGDEELAALEDQHGPLPDTWMCLTGGGGVHHYFRCDDPALTVAARFAPGLDYRGEGGYVIVPPSRHPETGRAYEWEAAHRPDDTGLAPLPEWLHRLMLGGKKRTSEPTTTSTGQFSEGTRNQSLFNLAYSMRKIGFDTSEIEKAIMEANRRRCVPPLDEQEVRRICESAGKYEKLPTQAPKPGIISAAEVPYSPPRWTIAPYFQRGKLTMIQGENGSGKTAFICGVAALISTGSPLLGIPVSAPGDVLILSVEDDLPVLRGRIEADGCDLTKCQFMTNSAGLNFTSSEV